MCMGVVCSLTLAWTPFADLTLAWVQSFRVIMRTLVTAVSLAPTPVAFERNFDVGFGTGT